MQQVPLSMKHNKNRKTVFYVTNCQNLRKACRSLHLSIKIFHSAKTFLHKKQVYVSKNIIRRKSQFFCVWIFPTMFSDTPPIIISLKTILWSDQKWTKHKPFSRQTENFLLAFQVYLTALSLPSKITGARTVQYRATFHIMVQNFYAKMSFLNQYLSDATKFNLSPQ